MFKSSQKGLAARAVAAALVVAALVVAVGVGYVGYTVNAASTGNVTLMGTVGAAMDIEVTPAGSYNSLGLGSSQTDVLVATVRERSNVTYDVSVQSTNYASCSSATSCLISGANIVPLTLKINGNTISHRRLGRLQGRRRRVAELDDGGKHDGQLHDRLPASGGHLHGDLYPHPHRGLGRPPGNGAGPPTAVENRRGRPAAAGGARPASEIDWDQRGIPPGAVYYFANHRVRL